MIMRLQVHMYQSSWDVNMVAAGIYCGVQYNAHGLENMNTYINGN
jgi:hypothetical protein